MHSSGSMTRIRFASWMQSTGQTSTQDLSLMSMQGSAMMYVTRATLAKRSPRRRQLLDELAGAFDEGRLRHDLIESGCMRGTEACRVGVVRVAQDRNVEIRVGDFLRVDARDVRDHELGRVRMVDRDEAMLGQERLELPTEEEIDPTQQDRGHARKVRSHACPVQAGARAHPGGRVLGGAGGGGGRRAGPPRRGARLLPGPRARRRCLVPG